MAQYTATVSWARSGAPFIDKRYSRAHEWRFDGGTTVPASASPHVVPARMSDPRGIDPEEAFVASLASCHMLNFLLFAAKGGFIIDSYNDTASGVMEKNAEGRMAVTRVTLRRECASLASVSQVKRRCSDYTSNPITTALSPTRCAPLSRWTRRLESRGQGSLAA